MGQPGTEVKSLLSYRSLWASERKGSKVRLRDVKKKMQHENGRKNSTRKQLKAPLKDFE